MVKPKVPKARIGSVLSRSPLSGKLMYQPDCVVKLTALFDPVRTALPVLQIDAGDPVGQVVSTAVCWTKQFVVNVVVQVEFAPLGPCGGVV